MFELGTSEHMFINKVTVEYVRIKHLCKECNKMQCENVEAIEGSIDKIKDLIEEFVKNVQ